PRPPRPGHRRRAPGRGLPRRRPRRGAPGARRHQRLPPRAGPSLFLDRPRHAPYRRLSHVRHPVERRRSHLPPAEGAGHRDDARWPAPTWRRPPLRAPGRGRVPAQPDHGVARLPGAGRRGPGGEAPRAGHVCHRGSVAEAAQERARTLPHRRVAAGPGAHPAAWPHARGTAARRRRCMNTLETVIDARGLRKAYRKGAVALDGTTFRVGRGRIVGLIGPNGAGKTTALKAVLGLIPFEGELSVTGRDPRRERDALMNDVCFIADVAVLPRWMRVREAIAFVEGVHPRFDRARCERFLANTKLTPTMRVREMSKGMIVQLHLALVMAIDARLL